MIVIVDLATSSVSLDEPDDLKGFKVSALGQPAAGPADDAAIGTLLEEIGGGRDAEDPDHVWIAIDTVRLLAADQVGEDWAEQFGAMVAYAATKGWLDDEATHIKAHVERP